MDKPSFSHGRQSAGVPQALLKGEHYDFLERLLHWRPLKSADRAEDRVRQHVRRLGLALVAKNPRRWILTPLGLETLQRAGRARMTDTIRENPNG